MPGVASDSGNSSALVPYTPEHQNAVVFPLRHGLSHPISRLSISFSRGNSLRVSLFLNPDQIGGGGKVLQLKLDKEEAELSDDAQWRRIAYESVTPFALLQSRKNAIASMEKMNGGANPYAPRWQEYIIEYGKDISSILGNKSLSPISAIEDPKTIIQKVEKPTALKAAWELLQMFYAHQQSQTWIPEQLVDWLSVYDVIFSGTQQTVHSELVDFQIELVTLQEVEDNPKYWKVVSYALAIGWLDIVVKLLRLHGSYQQNQIGSRETENGLVEAVAVLLSKMPRLRPRLDSGKLGKSYESKSDFVKAWEKWRGHITKLDCSAFWLQCGHQKTREGLKNMLQIMLGNFSILSSATFHWVELYVANFLYIRPFTTGMESMYNLAQKCLQSKPTSSPHKLTQLLTGILGENTEVVLAACSSSFGPWMVAHAVELLTAGSTHAEILLHDERNNLGGVSLEELYRLVYSQVLASHALTWQLAPVYLAACMKQGMGLLEILLYKQPVRYNQVLLKNIEICCIYELSAVSSNAMKIAGIHHWKHGRKGSGIFWLQQARDEVRLNGIAQQLFDFIGKSVSDESFKQWEGLIELLGSETRTVGGLEFLHKYRDFKKSLQQVHNRMATDAAQKASEALIALMKNPSTPQRFWLPLLYDSVKLLNWQERTLLNVSQTNLLLNKLQELSMARLRPDFVEADLPPQSLSSVRLALATNLGRAILEE